MWKIDVDGNASNERGEKMWLDELVAKIEAEDD